MMANGNLLRKLFDQPGHMPAALKAQIRHETGEPVQIYALCDLSAELKFSENWIALTDSKIAIARSGAADAGAWEIETVPMGQLSRLEIVEGYTTNRLELIGKEDQAVSAPVYFTRRQFKAIGNVKLLAEQQSTLLQKDRAARFTDHADDKYRESILQVLREAKSTIMQRQRNVFLRLLAYLKPHKKVVAFGFSASLVITILQLLPPYITRVLVDDVFRPAEKGTLANPLHYVWLLVSALAAVRVSSEVLNYFRLRIMSLAGEKIATQLRDDIYRHIQKLSLSFYNQRSTGGIISRITSDTDRLWDFITFGIIEFIMAAITLIGVATALFLQDASLAIIVVVPLPLLLYFFYRHSRKIQGMFLRIWRKWSELTAVLSDVVPGIRVVRAFAQEAFEVKRFSHKNRSLRAEAFRLHRYWTAFWPRMVMLMHLSSLSVWAFGAPRVLQYIDSGGREGMPLGVFIAFTGYMWMFWGPLQHIGTMTRTFNRAVSSASRVFEILDTTPMITTKKGAHKLEPLAGKVEFKDVTFSYDGIRNVLKHVDFVVEPGEMIGLVGASGSGKSTLVNLICRFYDVKDGAILLDGYDLRDLHLPSLRRQIGVVLQEPYLFHGTIAQNIAYGHQSASMGEIIEAARAANAHDFICQLPDAYDSLVGERGLMLSGGERQRISIARAILHDPKLLILDEATSSVDTETEKKIQEALARLVSGRTTFAIAHRLSTLNSASRLFVMDNGALVEQGTHAELLALPNGVYSRLHRTQSELQALIAV